VAASAAVAAVAAVADAADARAPRDGMELTVTNHSWLRAISARNTARLLLVLGMQLLAATAHAAASPQRTFGTPEDAASALIAAVKANDRAATLAVLGDAGDWISSGDAVADRAIADRFVAQYEKQHAIATDGDKATLALGDDAFPFAFPLVRTHERWRFDTAAGKDELLKRRVGGNELTTLQVLQAIVDAQLDYASEDRNGDGVPAYAQRFASSPGKRDGLYWPSGTGEPASPLGVLVAQAAAEGYKQADRPPTPYHGYYFRMLKGQGTHAQTGSFDYVVRGRGIAGFAVVAYPAKYGNSGIMTFMVNQDGKIYQADLGPQTQQKAQRMQRFDPGSGWSPSEIR
jgi:hypothetical protein